VGKGNQDVDQLISLVFRYPYFEPNVEMTVFQWLFAAI